MWIYVPDPDEMMEPWVGTVTLDESPKSRWGFELIRRTDAEHLYSSQPFEQGKPVLALLDHQTRCTIIRPFVRKIDPGSIGFKIPFSRTRIEGEFQALLHDLEVEDESKEMFTGVSFSSEAFAAWYARRNFQMSLESEGKHSIDVPTPVTEEFELQGWGKVACTTATNISSQFRSAAVESVSIFRMDFDKTRSLADVLELSWSLEQLFGFLIGYRPKPPEFRLRTGEKHKWGDQEIPEEGRLQLSGVDWIDRGYIHPGECINVCGRANSSVAAVTKTFLDARDDFATRMSAVEFSRFFSRSINDRFSVVMPVLEEYLRRTYTSADESSYTDQQSKFFDWVDAANDPVVKEFSQKHIIVKDAKTPSLKTLLLRAIKTVNDSGFSFPQSIAGDIQKRRGQVFHSVPQMNREDARAFYIEVLAATGILMLHTYRDLGINIRSIIDSQLAFGELRAFVEHPSKGTAS